MRPWAFFQYKRSFYSRGHKYSYDFRPYVFVRSTCGNFRVRTISLYRWRVGIAHIKAFKTCPRGMGGQFHIQSEIFAPQVKNMNFSRCRKTAFLALNWSKSPQTGTPWLFSDLFGCHWALNGSQNHQHQVGAHRSNVPKENNHFCPF